MCRNDRYWFDLNRSSLHEDMSKNVLGFSFTLTFALFILELELEFISASSKIPIKYELSMAFQY